MNTNRFTRSVLGMLAIVFMAICCTKAPDYMGESQKEKIEENVRTVFGVSFPSSNDWNSVVNGSVLVNVTDASSLDKVQVLSSTYVYDNTNASDNTAESYETTILNEIYPQGDGNYTIYFDAPKDYSILLVAFVYKDGNYEYVPFSEPGNTVMQGAKKASTRSDSYSHVTNGHTDETILGTVETFASKRGWLPGEVIYTTSISGETVADYDEAFKEVFNSILFSHFKNGKAYNNLPLIKKSGYYNETSYPITTGDEPIIVSPVYKNDGGYHEISEADLYYYYFKGDIDLTTEQIEALPKFRAICLSEVYENSYNNKTKKEKSYKLAYFGDGPVAPGMSGSYRFPKGYKIGFMYHSKTTYEQPKKQGELYCDGRLNYNINSWGNFKSSKLGPTEPRMAWMSINGHSLLCVESGTDSDFNDLIVEVEGGIEPIIVPPVHEDNFYTFCFEDRRLGDYDMNDVVIKGTRINETTVEWTLMASGANDELYVRNINGQKIKDNAEIHDVFGQPRGTYVNTISGNTVPYVTDRVAVNKSFSFLDVTTQPYVYDATQDWIVKVSQRGEDPHAIMIPYDFRWPLEKTCIKDAYLMFNSWGVSGCVSDNDWFKNPVGGKTF